MKLDDYTWHCEGDFPSDIPDVAGATHIGMLLTWLALNSLLADDCVAEIRTHISAIANKGVTPGQFGLAAFDGKLDMEDLSPKGKEFLFAYYGNYLGDYAQVFEHIGDSIYHVDDSWEAYGLLEPNLDQRFGDFQMGSCP